MTLLCSVSISKWSAELTTWSCSRLHSQPRKIGFAISNIPKGGFQFKGIGSPRFIPTKKLRDPHNVSSWRLSIALQHIFYTSWRFHHDFPPIYKSLEFWTITWNNSDMLNLWLWWRLEVLRLSSSRDWYFAHSIVHMWLFNKFRGILIFFVSVNIFYCEVSAFGKWYFRIQKDFQSGIEIAANQKYNGISRLALQYFAIWNQSFSSVNRCGVMF